MLERERDRFDRCNSKYLFFKKKKNILFSKNTNEKLLCGTHLNSFWKWALDIGLYFGYLDMAFIILTKFISGFQKKSLRNEDVKIYYFFLARNNFY